MAEAGVEPPDSLKPAAALTAPETAWAKTVPAQVRPFRPDAPDLPPHFNQNATLQATIKTRNPVDSAARLPTRLFVLKNNPQADSSDYVVESVIGEGGMGIVFRAFQRSLKRFVAVKTIRADTAQKIEARRLFTSEALITGDLDHPNIVPVHELGLSSEGQLFYTMKEVQGTPWREVIGSKTLEENLEILLRVSDAIAFAHSRRILHCDLKPENIMLGNFGEVMVMDWGLALSFDELADAQSSGLKSSLGGTPCYLPPEFAKHELEKVGPASDIYLLGGLLYEILSGRMPHRGETATATEEAAARNEILPIPQHPEWAAIALRALATEPSDRQASVQEFQQELRECRRHQDSHQLADTAWNYLQEARVQGRYQDYSRSMHAYEQALNLWPENTSARTSLNYARDCYAHHALEREDLDLAESLLNPDQEEHQALQQEIDRRRRERIFRQNANRRLKLGLIALTGLVITTLTITQAWIRSQRNAAEYEALINGTRLAVERLWNGNWEEVLALQRQFRTPPQGWEWEWLEQNAQTITRPLSGPGAPLRVTRHSGSLSVQLFEDGTFYLEQDGGKWSWRHSTPILDFRLPSSSSTPVIMGWNGKQILTWDLQGHLLREVLLPPGLSASGRLSPDGRLLFLTYPEQPPVLVQTEDLRVVHTFSLPPGSHCQIGDISPDGRYLALLLHPNQVLIWDIVADQQASLSAKFHGGQKNDLDRLEYAPDGRAIFIGSFDQGVASLDPRTLTPRLTLPLPSPLSAFAASADNQWLAAGTLKGELQIQDRNSGDLIWRTHLPEKAITSLAFAQNPTRLLLTDAQQQLWELPLKARQPWRTLAQNTFPFLRLTWRPDAQGLFVSAQNGSVSQLPLNAGDGGLSAPFLRGLVPRFSQAWIRENGQLKVIGATDHGLIAWDEASHEVSSWWSGGYVQATEATSDGLWLAAAVENQVTIFDAGQHREYAHWTMLHPVSAMKWSPDGLSLIVGDGGGNLRVWRRSDRTTPLQFEQKQTILALAISPDGSQLAASSQDRAVCLWNLRSEKLEHKLEGHEHVVLCLDYTPDQTRLLTGSADGKIHVFDLKTDREIVSYLAHRGATLQLLISPDGSTLVTSGTDGEIRLWPGRRTPPAWR
jgi:serine/threonine protein kinase/WD40 repeat protein